MWQPSTPAPPMRERVDASTTTFLRSIPAFQGFGENQLKRIRAALRRRAYAAHEILIEQGAAIERDAFFVLASGRVRVLVDGRQVAVLSAGDYVGERALVLREPRASTCVADAEGCACLVLDAEAWEDAVLARGSEDLSPSKRTRRRSSWVRSFNAYEHDARDEGAARLGAFAADYAALLSETSGDGDRVARCAAALRDEALPPAVAADLRLLLLEEVTPELSADERHRQLFAKYGDLTGGGLVAPTIAQAGELMHRRSHLSVGKLRATAHTTADAPRVLASATACSCTSCAAARIRRKAHSTTLSTPAAEPGTLHLDLKELVLSFGNYRYVVFAIKSSSRRRRSSDVAKSASSISRRPVVVASKSSW